MTNNGSGLWTPGGAGEFDGKDILDEEPVWLDTIDEEDVNWLWESRIPFVSVSVVDGDPDNGKSLISTTSLPTNEGRPFPFEPEACCRPPGVDDRWRGQPVPHDCSATQSRPSKPEHGRDDALATRLTGQVEPLMIPRDLDRI